MVLGTEKLLELVKKNNLLTNLSKRELENPEGSGFDLRMGELYELSGKGFLGEEERNTPEAKLIAKFKEGERIRIVLKPKTYYTFKTYEEVNMPDNLLAMFAARSTLYRSGIHVFAGEVAPGYKGGLTMGLYNFRDEPFELEMGARVIHIMFFEVNGSSNLYRGQWQGGRVFTNTKEKQI